MAHENTQIPMVLRVLALAIALTLLAACGSTDGGEASSGTETTEPDQATTTTEDNGHDHEEDHDDHDHDSGSESHGGEDEEMGSPVELDRARRLLVVAANDQPRLDLIDLADGESVSLELDAPASLGSSMTEDGRFVLAASDDGVTVIDSGVWSEVHGDHFHHYAQAPSLLDRVDGPRPSHLVSHHDVTALFFDGTGEAVIIDEPALADGSVTTKGTVDTGMPHHGFVVPTGDSFVVTVPTEDMDLLPDVVGVVDGAGELETQFDCPLVHGETGLADGAAAACGDGVLVLILEDGAWTGTHLSYPEVDDLDPYGYGAARAWALAPSPGGELIAAPYGANHLLVVDPSAPTLTAFDLGVGLATLGVAVHSSGAVVVLTLDGSVLLVDDGSIVSSVEAIAPFTEGDPEEPYRLLTLAGDLAYVSDPSSNQVVEISIAGRLAVERTIGVGFPPSFIAVANG